MKATFTGTWKSLRRMLSYTKGNRIQFYTGLLIDCSDSLVTNAVFSYILMILFSGIESKDPTSVGRVLLSLGLGSILFLAVFVLGPWMQQRASVRAVARLRRDVMDQTLSLPTMWFDERHSGDVLSRLTSGMQAAEQSLGWQLRFPLKGLLAGVGCTVMMFALEWRMALVSLVLGVVSVWVLSRFATPIKKASDKIQTGLGRVSEAASDLLAAAPVLRVFNLARWAGGRMDGASEEVFRHSRKRVRYQTGQDVANSFSGWLMFVGLVLIGSLGVIYQWFSFATLLAVIQLNNGLGMMFQTIGGAFSQLQGSLSGANRVFEILDAEKELADEEELVPTPGSPAIRLDEVSFTYDGSHDVLSKLTGIVQPGETVALVGGSGCGKSTALKLLLGFYGAQSGRIELFGHRQSGCSTALRRCIAYVPQTCYLFSGTVRDNIAAGRPGASDAEIVQAAKAALAHDFILELPQGYDTEVGERGAQLSGGQRQRIAIARAILKDAPLLLLDEATASLDSQSEAQVQAALERLMQGRTVVVVAHRLSTVRNADRILVLEGGTIVEQGPHDELLRLDGRYAAYYRMQFEGKEAVPA